MTPTPEIELSGNSGELPTPETADIAGLVAFANEAAAYFEKRDTGGEDMAHWSNVYNAENCRKLATALQSLSAELAEAKRREAEACRYLENLLRSYVGKYCDPVPDWRPLPDLLGMLTQIDNASTVTADFLTRATTAEAEARAMREALEQAKLYVERDEEAHGRKFGTGNAIRAALAREGK